MEVAELKLRAQQFIDVTDKIIIENTAAIKSRENIEKTIESLMEANKNNKEALDIASHAIDILRKVSDEAVGKAYGFLEQSINTALERMFRNTKRKIRINEYTRGNQYPQLELILEVGNGKKRSLKSDSGHGIAQIVSLLSILSIIVITGSRRILVMDEIISGTSVHNRQIISDIMWSFTEIGFQFIVNDHGFVPKGAHVYHLEMVGDVSSVKQHYISQNGIYLQGNVDEEYDYSENTKVVMVGNKENEGTVTENTVEEVELPSTPQDSSFENNEIVSI